MTGMEYKHGRLFKVLCTPKTLWLFQPNQLVISIPFQIYITAEVRCSRVGQLNVWCLNFTMISKLVMIVTVYISVLPHHISIFHC